MPKCTTCGDEYKDYYLNEYVIEVQSPEQRVYQAKVEGVCNLCLQNLVDRLNKFVTQVP